MFAAQRCSVSEALQQTRCYVGQEPRGEISAILYGVVRPPVLDSERSSFEEWSAGVDALLAEVKAQREEP